MRFLVAYVIYIAITRCMLSIVLFTYARSVDLNYVWCLYANQLLNAAVKVYMMWRLVQAEMGQPRQPEAGLRRQRPRGDGAECDGRST